MSLSFFLNEFFNDFQNISKNNLFKIYFYELSLRIVKELKIKGVVPILCEKTIKT